MAEKAYQMKLRQHTELHVCSIDIHKYCILTIYL